MGCRRRRGIRIGSVDNHVRLWGMVLCRLGSFLFYRRSRCAPNWVTVDLPFLNTVHNITSLGFEPRLKPPRASAQQTSSDQQHLEFYETLHQQIGRQLIHSRFSLRAKQSVRMSGTET